MDEYIKRKTTIDYLGRRLVNKPSLFGRLCARIASIPAADVVEVRHGEWKKIWLVGCEPIYKCSLCDKCHDQDYDYCNNCGAKMDGGK